MKRNFSELRVPLGWKWIVKWTNLKPQGTIQPYRLIWRTDNRRLI